MNPVVMRTCKECGEHKPLTEYYMDEIRFRHKCKECHKSDRRHRRILRYGIDRNEYNRLYKQQCGVCYLCGEPETLIQPNGNLQRLSIEHCHRTGVVRGLACSNCNLAIGALNDDIPAMRNVIKRFQEVTQYANN